MARIRPGKPGSGGALLLASTAVSNTASACCIALIAARMRSGSTLARATWPISAREKTGRSGAGTRGRAGSGSDEAVVASIRSSSERRTRSFRCPARVALSRPRETHRRTVAGLTLSSSAISARVSHGSSARSDSFSVIGASFQSCTVAQSTQLRYLDFAAALQIPRSNGRRQVSVPPRRPSDRHDAARSQR